MIEEIIKDYSSYNNGMHKSILDKLFFIDKINNINGILDYGCADGELINNINKIHPIIPHLFGYDLNPTMINLAKEKNTYKNMKFFDNLDLLLHDSQFNPNYFCLNLSSVIHEVYSYCEPKEIVDFWDFVFNSNFKYIAIRDMCVSNSCNRETDLNDYRKLLTYANLQMLNNYESYWSSCQNNKNMIHFLLKYRYSTNWEREVKENYLPISYETILKLIPKNYEIIYLDHYTLPFLKQKVKEDYDINLIDKTHIKLLLRKKY